VTKAPLPTRAAVPVTKTLVLKSNGQIAVYFSVRRVILKSKKVKMALI
jgi:hypothetical protein